MGASLPELSDEADETARKGLIELGKFFKENASALGEACARLEASLKSEIDKLQRDLN